MMARNSLILIILLTILAGLTVLLSGHGVLISQNLSSSSPQTNKMMIGEAPRFRFQTLTDKSYALEDFRGKPLLVHFWASWCPPCVVEFPDLVKLAENNLDNLTIIAISTDKTAEAMKRFLEKHAPQRPDNFMIVYDADKSLTEKLFGTYKLPETYIYDENLSLQDKIIGAYADWESYFDTPL